MLVWSRPLSKISLKLLRLSLQSLRCAWFGNWIHCLFAARWSTFSGSTFADIECIKLQEAHPSSAEVSRASFLQSLTLWYVTAFVDKSMVISEPMHNPIQFWRTLHGVLILSVTLMSSFSIKLLENAYQHVLLIYYVLELLLLSGIIEGLNERACNTISCRRYGQWKLFLQVLTCGYSIV